MSSASKHSVINLVDNDEDDWDALDEVEGRKSVAPRAKKTKGKSDRQRPSWLPDGMEPILEELPKWTLLGEILKETEDEIIRQESVRNPLPSCEHRFILQSTVVFKDNR